MPSPQPWEVRSRFIRGKHRPCVEIHAPTHRVATLNPTDRPKKTAGTIYDEAAIIAAAPDLLTALQDVMGWYNSPRVASLMSKMGEQAEYHRTKNAAYKAIRKALNIRAE